MTGEHPGAGPGRPASDGRDESQLERVDRKFDDLLQELRVMQTGVQVLFAFLLGVPFTQRFLTLDSEQRLLYFAVLVAAAASVLCLLAPSAWHRALSGRDDKAHVLAVSHRLAVAGLGFVGLAVCGVVALIATVLYPGTPSIIVAVASPSVFLLVWLVLPYRRRRAAR